MKKQLTDHLQNLAALPDTKNDHIDASWNTSYSMIGPILNYNPKHRDLAYRSFVNARKEKSKREWIINQINCVNQIKKIASLADEKNITIATK